MRGRGFGYADDAADNDAIVFYGAVLHSFTSVDNHVVVNDDAVVSEDGFFINFHGCCC